MVKSKASSSKVTTKKVVKAVKKKVIVKSGVKTPKPKQVVKKELKTRSVTKEELLEDEDMDDLEEEDDALPEEETEEEEDGDESDDEIRLTPKIRVNKLSGGRNGLSNDFVVALRNKRKSYVDESDKSGEEELETEEEIEVEEEAPVLAEKLVAKKDLNLEPEEEDDSSIEIGESEGPDELADLLPADEQISKSIASEKPKKLVESEEAEADEELAKAEEHKAHNVKIYKRIALVFSVLVFFVLIGVLYFTMVKATISIALNEQTINDQAAIQVYDRPQDFSLPAKSVRGLVKLVPAEQSKLYQVSGHDVIGEEVVGQITLYNKYNKSQPLVASTRLLSASGKLYRLKDSVTVPAGGQVAADIYADDPKPESVVGAELFTVPGLWEGLQDKIYGQSLAGAIKYQQKLRRIVTQEDIDKALADLKQILKDKVKADFDNTYNDYDYKFYNLDEATLKFAVSGKVGEEKDQLPVSMSGTVEVIAFNSDQAQDIARLSSTAKLPAGQDLLTLDAANLKYELVKFDPNLVMTEVNMTYDVKVRANNKNEIVDKNKIIGLSEDQLKQYLSNIKDIRTYNIEFYPSFIKQVPRLTDRIEVKVVE